MTYCSPEDPAIVHTSVKPPGSIRVAATQRPRASAWGPPPADRRGRFLLSSDRAAKSSDDQVLSLVHCAALRRFYEGLRGRAQGSRALRWASTAADETDVLCSQHASRFLRLARKIRLCFTEQACMGLGRLRDIMIVLTISRSPRALAMTCTRLPFSLSSVDHGRQVDIESTILTHREFVANGGYIPLLC